MDDESGESIEPMEEVPFSAYGWRRGIGVVVSGIRRMNEVNARRAHLRAGIPSRYVTNQLDQVILASHRGH